MVGEKQKLMGLGFTDDEDETEEETKSVMNADRETFRNCAAFFILGVLAPATYTISITAAYDLMALSDKNQGIDHKVAKNGFQCNKHATATVLFVSVFPGLILKCCAPFCIHLFNYHCRFIMIVVSAILSLSLLGLSKNVLFILLGVGLGSISMGLSDIVTISLTSFYGEKTLKFLSSGIGFSYTFTFAYAAMTTAGLLPQTTILIFLFVPALQIVTFWVYLRLPEELQALCGSSYQKECPTVAMSFTERCTRIALLWRFVVPMVLVYFAEYSINQGLYEFMYYDLPWISQAEQYRWYQCIYAVGVIISRSSSSVIRIRNVWILALLQYVMLIIFVFQVLFPYISSIFVTFALILFEGLLGGGVYINSFLNVSENIEDEYIEFSLGVTSASEEIGITLASLVTMPLHSLLCDYVLRRMQVSN